MGESKIHYKIGGKTICQAKSQLFADNLLDVNCKRCQGFIVKYNYIIPLLEKYSLRQISKKLKMPITTVVRWHQLYIKYINPSKTVVQLDKKVWKVLSKYNLPEVVVNSDGIFKNSVTGAEYCLYYDKRLNKLLFSSHRKCSVNKIIYEVFSNTIVTRQYIILYKDGNPLNIKYDNLYLTLASEYRAKKYLQNTIIKWKELITDNDTRQTFSKKINKSLSWVNIKIRNMKNELNIPSNIHLKFTDTYKRYVHHITTTGNHHEEYRIAHQS